MRFFLTSPVVLLVAVLSTLGLWDTASAPWAAAQIVKALWPFPSPLAESVETWAWAQWEAPLLYRKLQSRPVPELPLGEPPPPDRARPFIVRGLLNGTGSPLVGNDFSWLTRGALGQLEVDFFSNASVEDGLVPDARGPLGSVVESIVNGGTAKLGTEMIFRSFPELLGQLQVAERVGPLLGGESYIRESRLGTTLTVPVFMACGKPRSRTDLHAEPIGNLMLQLGGRKRWTLVAPDQSRFLRPTLSGDGRAYFVSKQPTADPEESLRHVERWSVETDSGDALWVPTWTWHRVDYIDGVVALSASLFHFRTEQVIRHNALFSVLAIPNVAKELIGWKTQ